MNYKRFRHFGKDKIFMDFAFFAIAFNIKKMCAKMAKEGMDWLIRLFYELTVAIFRCCEHINQRKPQNIAALKNEPIFIVNEKRRRIAYMTHLHFYCKYFVSYSCSYLLKHAP